MGEDEDKRRVSGVGVGVALVMMSSLQVALLTVENNLSIANILSDLIHYIKQTVSLNIDPH